MEKIELEIVALSHSITQSQSYAVVLGEAKGVRRLPIVIGGFEAQAIAVALEKMSPSRPLTHDLVRNLFETFNISLKEIIISNLKDGIFYAQLVCQNGSDDKVIEVDSRTSDALALAVRFGCPIFTYEFILDSAGIIMEESMNQDDDEDEDDEEIEIEGVEAAEPAPKAEKPKDLSKVSLNDLEDLLSNALEKEDYEWAIKLRDEISRREKNS